MDTEPLLVHLGLRALHAARCHRRAMRRGAPGEIVNSAFAARIEAWNSFQSAKALMAEHPRRVDYNLLETLVEDLIDVFGQAVDGDEPIGGPDAVDWISENLERFRRALGRQ